MSKDSLFFPAASGLIILAITSTAHAQKIVRSKGTIDAVRPGFIKVTDADGEWILKIDAKQEDILFEATAAPGWLQQGMLVRFVANLDDRGTAQEPIDDLTVFTPRTGYVVGVLRDSAFAGQTNTLGDKKRRRRQPAVKIKSAQDEENETESTDGAQFLVAGQLARRDGNQLLVVAGRDRVIATLGDEAKIKVDLQGDYSLAKPGDDIEFVARTLAPQNGPGGARATARRVKITSADPLMARPEPERRPQRRSRRRQKIEAAVGRPLPDHEPM